ncbi:MAG: hypothetical protein EBU01_13510 [Crocinitomicaceae bacterium]|jgi:hypothetical protein|nr:hypothetical protein [Crocinitomicaceae bacterium]NCA23010.1 hypothetical protein [Crocinitomicaceae bacterium]
MSNLVRKYKKLFLELKYLYAELEYYEEELQEAQANFKEEFYKKCEQLNLNVKKPEEKKEENSTEISTSVNPFEQQEEQNDNTIPIVEQEAEQPKTDDEEISKLYKKIVFLTHPDSIPANEKEQLKQKRTKQFLQAQEAYRSKNWFLICEIAMELGIDIPEPNKKQLKWIEEESSRVKERILHIKNLYAWVWHTSEDNKDGIMERYVKSVVK